MLDQSRLICMCIYKGYSVLYLSIGADAIVGWVAGVAHEMKRTAHCTKIQVYVKKCSKPIKKCPCPNKSSKDVQKCVYIHIYVYIYNYIYVIIYMYMCVYMYSYIGVHSYIHSPLG